MKESHRSTWCYPPGAIPQHPILTATSLRNAHDARNVFLLSRPLVMFTIKYQVNSRKIFSREVRGDRGHLVLQQGIEYYAHSQWHHIFLRGSQEQAY